ncbi:MAG: sulfite exporter TauE/SafE family protein [Burkholderiales bacterium]|nr:sulfite exporter TauE/SafE family protein [Burkholderiales bacterium]
MPDTEVLLFAPLVILLAYVIFGISGFGSTLIAVPLLAHLFPLRFVIPMVVLLDCVSAISMGSRLRTDVNRRELVPLLPFLAIGMVAGVFVLMHVPGDVLLAALGAFVLAYGAYYALKRGPAFRLARWTAAPVGLFAGATSSTFGVGGPIYVMYLTARGVTPEQLRATIPVIFIVTTIVRIALFATAGLYSKETFITAALLFPMMALGLYIGNRAHLSLSREHMARIIGALLLVSGASLLIRALGG